MKFKVGDKVRVRSWEDMEKEFGLNENGNIDTEVVFVTDMKKYCGKIVEIVDDEKLTRTYANMTSEIVEYFYKIREDNVEWCWTDEMFEPAFDWESFKDESKKIAVHCKTEEEAKDFCRKMHEHGMTWSDGDSYLEYTCWGVERKETCYTGYGTYCGYSQLKVRKWKILEYADYFTKETQKPLIPKKCRRVLKQLNKDYKWIAKDMDGSVYIYTKAPVRDLYEWISQGKKERIDELFPELDYNWLSFEDYMPVNFRKVLKGE